MHYFLLMVWLSSSAAPSNGQSPPRLLRNAYDPERVVPEGSNVQLPCPVEASDLDTLYFEWYRDKEALVTFGEDRFRMLTNGALRIKSAVPEDTALYVCRAVNGFGWVDINMTLIVVASPDTLRPASVTEDEEDYDDETRADTANGYHDNMDQALFAAESGKPRFTHVTKFPGSVIHRPVGSSVRFKCDAAAKPRPLISWLRNSKPLSDNTKRGRWTLHLQNLQSTDTGNYTCLVYNGLGSITATFNLVVTDRVRSKPEMTGSHPINTTAEYGRTAVFQCRVRSDVPPHVQWLKRVSEKDTHRRNVIIVQGEYFRVLKSTAVIERSDGSFLNKLVIPDVTEDDSGKYICLGANTVGYSFRSAFLTVTPKSQKKGPVARQAEVPFPIIVTVAATGAVALVLLVVVLCHCYNRRSTGRSRTTSSKCSVSTETRHTFDVGMSHNPEATIAEYRAPSSSRLYNPVGQMHRTVHLNSVFV